MYQYNNEHDKQEVESNKKKVVGMFDINILLLNNTQDDVEDTMYFVGF